MGRRNRERVARILAGEETPISAQTRERIRNIGVSTLESYSTSKQVQFLAESLHSGRLSPSKLQGTLKRNAPGEMRKGAEKLNKKGKIPTVELLLKDYRGDKAFQTLAAEVGLDEAYFTALAESECSRWKEGV